MKKIALNSCIAIVLAISFVGFYSCSYLSSEEYLHEVDALNDIWKTRQDIRKAWAACYGRIPKFHDLPWTWPFSGGGDEGYAGRNVYTPLPLSQGKHGPDNLVTSNYWYEMYRSIRLCNQFLENSYQANDRILAEGEVETYNTDVRYLRAFYYSLLLELYGPFVIIDHTVDYSSADYPTTRNTIDECVDWLVKELDEVTAKLPHNAEIIQTDRGRPSKGAAMAVKARVLLWAASPLVNGNKDYAEFVNPDNAPYISQNYDENKWKLAAKANKDIIDLGYYQLFTVPANDRYTTVPLGDFAGNDVAYPNGPAGIDPYRSYKGLFAGGVNYWNPEAIWQVNTATDQSSDLTILGWPRSEKSVGNGSMWTMRVSAIQKIVDAFFMNNGHTIEEENRALYQDMGLAEVGDGYYIRGDDASEASPIKTNWLKTNKVQAPPSRCLNREARFYAVFGFQGRGWRQDDASVPYYYVDYRNAASDGYFETDRPSNRTGYSIVKWVNDDDNRYGGVYSKQFPYFRLAETYLSYIEALNEYDPSNSDIVKYLNLIRFRAGLPGYEPADQSTNRARIKRERYIEFAFEGKRYFDMRRWKDAENVQTDQWGNSLGVGGLIYGCDYMATDSKFYDRTAVDGYIFKKRHYFLPLPYIEVANHWGTMSQNPGW